MKLSDQVVSLQLAKRLKELGLKKPAIFGWIYHEHAENQAWACKHDHPNKHWLVIRGTNDHKPIMWADDNCKLQEQKDKEIAAYTSAELGEILPVYIERSDGISPIIQDRYYDAHGKNPCWFIQYFSDIRAYDCKEADARAKMLIYLLEQGLIENETS